MIIFPAIDILDNKAVRLMYGKREEITYYGTPIEMAIKWQLQGAEYLHLVDLNGAFDNNLTNSKTIIQVIKQCDIPVQIGGGIKSLDKIKFYLDEIGVNRVIVGTACVTDSNMMDKACALYGNKIVAGIDAKDGFVAIKGWVEKSTLTPLQIAMSMKERGIDTIVYTDINRDGAMCGVNVDATYELSQKSNLNIVASGGMASLEDVKAIKDKNIYGAILGRSIYNGAINLAQAIELSKK